MVYGTSNGRAWAAGFDTLPKVGACLPVAPMLHDGLRGPLYSKLYRVVSIERVIHALHFGGSYSEMRVYYQ